ncbi:uncharacterized protein LOC128210603 [Mya arenaria]|uniref:uncharacterized protein LOC128210603 n=1 Tax=Mya arenaria TaxID=6604 RepID=UPI0022E27BA6|nr:uncharacterized protein LOC128210603 [Mya arenaria]
MLMGEMLMVMMLMWLIAMLLMELITMLMMREVLMVIMLVVDGKDVDGEDGNGYDADVDGCNDVDMVKLKIKMKLFTRSSSLNSLWSLIYCVVVVILHCYITYLGVSKYRKLNNEDLWGGETPGELRTYIALIVLALFFLPLFVFFSLLKVGNAANDSTKLGRDHALDSSGYSLGSKIKREWLRQLWEQFPPFSAIFHLSSAFLVLLPEVTITAAEVKYGIMASDAVWSCDLDFLFSADRASTSNIISQSNVTVQNNLSFYVVPTPRPPVGGWTHDTTLHVAFVYLAAGLIMLAVRYSAVFWFTNKVFSILFATQLLFMTVEALFAHCGVEVVYKVAVNYDKYHENVDIFLGPEVVLFLYGLSGIVLIGSTYFIYTYGANYFQEKFKIIDKRHHPETYRKQTMIVHGSCQDYRTHTAAVVSLITLGLLRGPILYDMVTLYRETRDSLLLTCLVLEVVYMVFWILLWTILTIKQQWQFRILDYVPLNEPIFMISNDTIVKSASYHGGSIELHTVGQKKRPSSLPSELTASESGFGDANSSEDEKERYEISLPPLAEVPGANLANSRRKGSTHSLDRRSRSRRNGNQRVTFHDTVKRSTSTDSELYARNKRHLNTSVEIHGRQDVRGRELTPLEIAILRSRRPGSRHSIGTPEQAETAPLNNAIERKQNSFSDLGAGSDYSSDRSRTSRPTPDSSIEYNDLTIKNDYALGARNNLKSSNMETQTNNNDANNSGPRMLSSPVKKISSSQSSPLKEPLQTIVNNINKSDRHHLSPRPLDYIENKKDIGLARRDSANYSLTSSQETASNDSDQAQQMCSQSKNSVKTSSQE